MECNATDDDSEEDDRQIHFNPVDDDEYYFTDDEEEFEAEGEFDADDFPEDGIFCAEDYIAMCKERLGEKMLTWECNLTEQKRRKVAPMSFLWGDVRYTVSKMEVHQ